MNNGYYGQVKAGSQRDMTIAYVIRGVMILMMWGLLNAAVDIRDDIKDYKKAFPLMQHDIKEIRVEVANRPTKDEMQEQIRKAKLTANP